jgi:hypothetical protein
MGRDCARKEAIISHYSGEVCRDEVYLEPPEPDHVDQCKLESN